MRGKRVNFIRIQRVEGPGFLRQRDAPQCRKIKLGDNERAGKVAIHAANFAFGEVGSKDFIVVHEIEKVYGAFLLTRYFA